MKFSKQTVVSEIKQVIYKAVKLFLQQNDNNIDQKTIKIQVDKTKDVKFGDFSSNVAMTLNFKNITKQEIANELIKNIDSDYFEKVVVASPGYINFYLNNDIKLAFLNNVLDQQDQYGFFKKKDIFYNLEFVSANPTGLLHIGHARNGAYGQTLADIWKAYGIKVDKEYYINDGGNQIKKLALSTLIRYLQLFNKNVDLPEDSYHGEEIIDVAKLLKDKFNDKFINTKFDTNEILDKNDNETISDFSKTYLLDLIKQDLKNLGVTIDIWFHESDIYKNNLIEKTFELLKKYTYEKDNALWLKTTEFNDDKDRVLKKTSGDYTYFSPDIAYHNIKMSRGYDKIFNIWGADHKSYVDRMTIAMQMLGYKKEQIYVCIMQIVQLLKDGKEFKMSKRSGNSFTLRDILEILGKNAARWYLVNQSLDTHIQIDIDKAKAKTSENGLFYVNYVYVRIKNILVKTKIKLVKKVDLLTNSLEKELINQLMFYKTTIKNIAKNYQVHKMCLYLTNLAKTFHSYYEQQIINDENNQQLTAQRLFLISNIAIIIRNGLKLLGIEVSEEM